MAAVWAYDAYTSGIPDEVAIRRAREGDESAFLCLLNRYRSLVERLAKRFYLPGAEFEDVVQEGMIGLLKAVRDFQDVTLPRFGPFAELCIARQIITAVKSAQRQKHHPLNTYHSLYKPMTDSQDAILLDILADAKTPDPCAASLRLAAPPDLLARLRAKLTPLELEVIQCYAESWSYEEMATCLQCHTKCIDNALQRAKRKVRRILA